MRLLTTTAIIAGCLILTGCQTDPATELGPTEAKLGGTAACPGDGAKGHIWYQVRPTGGSFVDATTKRRFECSAKTAEIAIPDTTTGLTPGRGYEFRMAVLFDNGNFTTWDSAGTQDGTAFDSFTTPKEPVVDVISVGTPHAVIASLPSLATRNKARRSGEKFWKHKGKLTSCMKNATVRWLKNGESITVPHRGGSGTSKLTMRAKIKGMGVGCSAPDDYDIGPGLMIFNKSITWTSADLCAAYKHELGHLYGLYHADSRKEPIMNSPVPFPMRVC